MYLFIEPGISDNCLCYCCWQKNVKCLCLNRVTGISIGQGDKANYIFNNDGYFLDFCAKITLWYFVIF